MHEIITLQLGQQSNYIGTHFWNIQESYFTYGEDEDASPVDHNINFRPGIGADGADTFTPRTLIYDLKGAFGTLRKLNALYEVAREPDLRNDALWYGFALLSSKNLWSFPYDETLTGSSVLQKETVIEQNAYQQHLDQGLEPPPLTVDSVRYWSDFNRVYYHPKSIVQLEEYQLNDQLMPFESWTVGEDLFEKLDREYDVLDRDLRPFAEECDQLQGFQVFSSVDDAWAGFARGYLDRLRDEFGKTSLWVWALEDGAKVALEKQLARQLNTARSLHYLSTQASLYIPISNRPHYYPRYVSANLEHPWQTSALQVTGIESIAMPSRMRSLSTSQNILQDMEAELIGTGKRNITELRFEVADVHAKEPSWHKEEISLFPGHQEKRLNGVKRTQTFEEIEAIRESNQAKEDEAEPDRNILLGSFETHSRHRFRSALPFPILSSFPHIYDFPDFHPTSLQVRSAFVMSSSVAERIRVLERRVRKVAALEEREELSNGLHELCEEYEEGWEGGSDMD